VLDVGLLHHQLGHRDVVPARAAVRQTARWLAENPPARGGIEVKRSFLHSTLRQRIVLYAGLPRIDFATEVDWHERGSAHGDAPMLRATFTPHFADTEATFETAFTAVSRPANGAEVPALRWADLSEGTQYGLSLLNNGKYGHQAHGNTLGLTLVRASYEPDVNPDEGLHRFTYALYPHAGDWRTGDTPERAAELNQPLRSAIAACEGNRLQTETALLRLDATPTQRRPGRVMLSALKPAEDQPPEGAAIIVRLYEAHGKPAEAVLHCAADLVAADSVSPIEEIIGQSGANAITLRKNSVRVRLQPHEIITIRLTLSHTES
jgi:alpha-mannosidase